MKLLATSSLGAFAAVALMSGAMAETRLTIATVNNGDMIRMQKLTDDFTKMNPDIALNWVTLEENVLRQGDNRHRHQVRPVRHLYDRNL